MKTLAEFKASLDNHLPDDDLNPQLISLWYDGKGNWQRTHGQVDHLDDEDSA